MDNQNFGRDQIIINDPKGKISIAETNAPREITVSGVGGTPPSFERYWVDRMSYQLQLRDRIASQPVTEIVAGGGFGKSSLAAWGYANLASGFQKRVWVSFGQPKTFDRVARWILQEIGFPNKDPQVNEETLLSELLYRLNEPNTPVKTLVVLDQLETIADSSDRPWFEQFLEQWAIDGKGSRVLVTTRSAFLSQDSIALLGMDDAEGSAFLTREELTGDRFSDLIRLANGHPLLLKLAASWTIETYEARVDDRAIDFFTKLFANYTVDPKAGVAAIFEVIFGALTPALQNLLGGLSVYRLPIELAMAQAMEGLATEEDLEGLAGQGLLLLQGMRYVLHPLVAGLVRARVTEEVRREGHERAIDYFKSQIQDKPIEADLEHVHAELEIFHHACEDGNYQQAYSIYSEIHDLVDLRGFHKETIQLLEPLIDRWTKQEDNLITISQCYRYIGNAYWSLGDYQKAIDFHSQSMEIEQAIGDKQGIAASLSHLGIAYDSLGDYQKAIDFHSQSMEITQSIGSKQGIAASLTNLGIAYDSLGDYQKAIDFHSQSMEIMQSIGDKQGIAASLSNLGSAYDSLGEHQKAIDFYSQCLEIMQAIGDKAGVAISLFNLSRSYKQRGRPQLSMHYRHQAYRIWQDMNLPVVAAPLPAWTKKLIQRMGDTWAEQLITSEKSIVWLFLPMGYLLFVLHPLLSARTRLQRKLKIKPLWYSFDVEIAIVLLIAWLKK